MAFGFDDVLTGAGLVGSLVSSIFGSDSQEEALESEKAQQGIKAAVDNQARIRSYNQVVAMQNAMVSSRNISVHSQGVTALQRSDFNNLAQDIYMTNLNEQAADASIQSRQNNIFPNMAAGAAGNLIDAAKVWGDDSYRSGTVPK